MDPIGNADGHTAAARYFPDLLWTAVVVSTSFAVLYGLFVALAVVSVYLLIRRGAHRPLSAIQLFAVSTLLISTTTHWSIVVLQRFGSLLAHPNKSVDALWTAFLVEQCVGTATLTINIILSDLVVWWRTWVLWPENRLVKAWGAILLLATLAMGVSDTHFSCKAEGGFMYEGLFVGNAASILSLSTNLAATILTAYKAWVCRKAFHRLMAKGSRTSQVESVLALLVESGALYCALWIVVVVWQVGIDNRFIKNSVMASLKKEPPRPSFWTVGGVLIEGCLVPLIAIYPTIIIVVVALNKSPVDNNMKGDLPGPDPLTVVVNTTVTSHSDLESPPRTSGEGRLPHDVDGDHKLADLADDDVSAMV